MLKNLSNEERTFRISVGILLILSIYNPGSVGNWIQWIVAITLIMTGLLLYCPLCQLLKK